MLIGKHYKKHGYNCADFVSEWYKKQLGIKIPVINEFDRSFLVWMRKNFTDIKSPEENCLVLMVNPTGGYHIGIYYDYFVYHNFKPGKGYGSVCKWTIGSVKTYYSKVSFHKWSQ
jgi:hypothetical protein